jgi:hypothetical protein
MDFLVHMKAAKHDHGHQAVPSDLTLRVKALESLAGSRVAAGLAQVRALPLPRGDRPARRATRIRPRAARGCRKYVFGTAQRKYVGSSAVPVMGVERSCLIWQTPALSVV